MLDTNVWLDLLLFEDPHCAKLRQAIKAGVMQPLSNHDCQIEWQRVLGYPALALSSAQQQALLTRQADWVRLVELQIDPQFAPLSAAPRCRDRDDQKFLDLAIAQRANCLFSRDLALLELAKRCQQRFGLWIGSPRNWVPPAHTV